MAPDYVFGTIGAHSYHSTLVPCFVSLRGSTYPGITQVMIVFGSSMTCFLFQLQIILSIVSQRATTGITRLVNWLGSSTVCYRRSNKDLHCLLWRSGMMMCCQITPNFLQLLMGSLWPGHECWQLSTRLGFHIRNENFNVMPVGF